MRPLLPPLTLAVRAFVLASFALLGACQLIPEKEPEYTPIPPIEVATEETPEPAPKPVPPPPPEPAPVALLVSHSIPAYQAVAESLEPLLERPPLVLNLDELTKAQTLEALEKERVVQAVAIGDKAFEMLATEPNLDIIYAQIFEPLAEHRGVPAIPPARLQLEYWKEQAPELSRVGALAGPEFEQTLLEMRAAGDELGIEVVSKLVANDKQAWLEFRRILPTIDGYVFLPDQSILSPSAIQRMLEHGSRNGVEFLTYNALLFKLGAQIHITQSPSDVAAQIAALIEAPEVTVRALTAFKVRRQGEEEFVDVSG